MISFNVRPLISFCGAFLFLSNIMGQSWSTVQTFGGVGNESVQDFIATPDGQWLLSANYSASFTLAGQALPAPQEDDLFLAKLNTNFEMDWLIVGGSKEDDAAGRISLDQEGNAFWIASFWEKIQFDGYSFELPLGGKGYFIQKINPTGELLWYTLVYGTGGKTLDVLNTDSDGNLYGLGTFNGLLSVGNTNLQTTSEEAVFLCKWNPMGDLLWIQHFESTDRLDVVDLVLGQEQLYFAGNFKDSLFFQAQTLVAQTWDQDGFVAAADLDGGFLWAQTVGAQYDDAINDLCLTENESLTVAGTFTGVLKIGPTAEIQTPGFNDNAFVAQLDSEGAVLTLQNIGFLGDEGISQVVAQGNNLLLLGTHDATFQLGNTELPAPSGSLNGWLANTNQDGTSYWLLDLPGTGFVLPKVVLRLPDGAIWVAGSFNSGLDFGGNSQPSQGFYDGFWAKVDPGSLSQSDLLQPTYRYQLHPNPFSDTITLTGEQPAELSIYDLKGTLLWHQQAARGVLSLRELPNGLLIVQVRSPDGGYLQQFKVLKQPR